MTTALSGVTGYKPVKAYVDFISLKDNSIVSKASSLKTLSPTSALAVSFQPMFAQTQLVPAAEGLTAHRGNVGRIQNEIQSAKQVATSQGDQGAPSVYSDKTMSFSAPIHRQVVQPLRSADDFDGASQADGGDDIRAQRETVPSGDSPNKVSQQDQSTGVAEHVTRFSPAHHESSDTFAESRTRENNPKHDPVQIIKPSSVPLHLSDALGPDVLSLRDDVFADGALPVVDASKPIALSTSIDPDAAIEATDMELVGLKKETITLSDSADSSIPLAPSLPRITVPVAPSIPAPSVKKIHGTKPTLSFLDELLARYGRDGVSSSSDKTDDKVHVRVNDKALTSEGDHQPTPSVPVAPSLPAVMVPVAPSIPLPLVKRALGAEGNLSFMDELRAHLDSRKRASAEAEALQASKGLKSTRESNNAQKGPVDPSVFGTMSGILQSIKRGVALKKTTPDEPKSVAEAKRDSLIDMLDRTKSGLLPSHLKRTLMADSKTDKQAPALNAPAHSTVVDLSRVYDDFPVLSLKPFAKRATPVLRKLDFASTEAPTFSEKQEVAHNKVEALPPLSLSAQKTDVPQVDQPVPVTVPTPAPVKRSSAEILAKVAFRQHSTGSLADILAKGGHLGLKTVQPQPAKEESLKEQPPVVQALSHSSGSFAARILSVSHDLDEAIDLDEEADWTDDENQTFEPENTSCNLYLSGQERTALYFEQLTKESELKTTKEDEDQGASTLQEKGSSQNHLLDVLSIRRKAMEGEDDGENDSKSPEGHSFASDDEEDFDF